MLTRDLDRWLFYHKIPFVCNRCTLNFLPGCDEALDTDEIPMDFGVSGISNDGKHVHLPPNDTSRSKDVWEETLYPWMHELFHHKKGLHLMHLNVRSLRPKLDEIKEILGSSNAAIFGLTETNQIKSVYWLIIVTVTIFTKRARKHYINNNIEQNILIISNNNTETKLSFN